MTLHNAATPSFLDTLNWGTRVPTNQIDVYFAPRGSRFDGEVSQGWNGYEVQQAMLALQQISNVANVSFRQVSNSSPAEFVAMTVVNQSYLGYFYPPGTSGAGIGAFSRDGTGWDEGGGGGLEKGGYGFVTLIHEFGHGMGLAHPHDTGGGSTIWQGVTSPFDSYGLGNQNQGLYTTMTYNDGWATQPGGSTNSFDYGYQGTMMAYDIALLQQKYGANTGFASGDNSYVLPGANRSGTYFESIWDTGGVDTISYGGSGRATIDLRAASLTGATGGGNVSYVDGVFGGFTIANKVLIENASAGAGNDLVRGNWAPNRLEGNFGADLIYGGNSNDVLFGGGLNDTLHGQQGRDTLWGQTGADGLYGGNGRDRLDGGNGNDRLEGGMGADILIGGGGDDVFVFGATAFFGTGTKKDTITDFGNGQDRIDLSGVDAISGGGDDAFRLIGGGWFSGAAGELRVVVKTADNKTLVKGDQDGDGLADFSLVLNGLHSLGGTDFIL